MPSPSGVATPERCPGRRGLARGRPSRWAGHERATSGRHRGRFERFTQVREDLADGPWFGDEGDQPDLTATRWALEGELLAPPGHEFRPRNPRGVVRAGFCMSCAAAFSGMSAGRMPAGRSQSQGLAGPPHRRPAGKRREFDDAIGSRPRRLLPAIPPDPGGSLVPRLTDSRSNAKGGRAQYLSKCSRLRR
jgi:hypothetical protein